MTTEKIKSPLEDIFKSLTDDELAKIPVLTGEEIKDCLDKGKKDANAYLRNCGMKGFYR